MQVAEVRIFCLRNSSTMYGRLVTFIEDHGMNIDCQLSYDNTDYDESGDDEDDSW